MKKAVGNNNIPDVKSSIVTKQWMNVLKQSGYEHHICSKGDLKKLNSRLWRRIIRHIHVHSGDSPIKTFEVGCGGGKHLVELSLRGWQCSGIDCSEDVIQRARQFTDEASSTSDNEITIEYITGDFLNYSINDNFDVTFHVGVLEHFLDDNVRLRALRKMFDITKSNGTVIHIVPNGAHPLRNEMRQFGLGGYVVPEIDYDCNKLYDELKTCGGIDIKILSHNIFSHVLLKQGNVISKILKKIYFYSWQIISPSLLPREFAYKHAGSLIGIAKKA